MDYQLFYLGPELTWSHAAALQAKRIIPVLTTSELVPVSSSDALYEKLASDERAYAIVPTYNLEQGIVYDFARFHIFEEIGSLELKTRMCLFGTVEHLSGLKKIYTKDTVVPQVNNWLSQLPKHIEIVARPDISTARGVQMAAAEAGAGAICSEAAGRAYNLQPLAMDVANKKENYTAFSVFKQGPWFRESKFIGSLPVIEFGITENVAERAKAGELHVLWHLSSQHNQHLHLGHISSILTLLKLAKWGNEIVLQIEAGQNADKLCAQLEVIFADYRYRFETAPDRLQIFDMESVMPEIRENLEKRANVIGCTRITGREELHTRLFCNHQLFLKALELTKADLVVAGPSLLPDLKMVATHINRTVPTLLVDYLPGTDNYAKMTAIKDNQINWPIGDQEIKLPTKALHRHFSKERLIVPLIDPKFSES